MKRLFLLLFLLLALVACGDQTAQPNLPATATDSARQTNVAVSLTALAATGTAESQFGVTPPPAQTPAWKTTHTFSGNGPKQTEIFSAPADWKLLYTCTYQDGGQVDGALSVEVYSADNTILDVAINATCHTVKSTGETEEHQGGQVYLRIDSTGDWTLQVQEMV